MNCVFWVRLHCSFCKLHSILQRSSRKSRFPTPSFWHEGKFKKTIGAATENRILQWERWILDAVPIGAYHNFILFIPASYGNCYQSIMAEKWLALFLPCFHPSTRSWWFNCWLRAQAKPKFWPVDLKSSKSFQLTVFLLHESLHASLSIQRFLVKLKGETQTKQSRHYCGIWSALAPRDLSNTLVRCISAYKTFSARSFALRSLKS